MALIVRIRSITPFIRPIRTATNPETAPSRKAGAVAWEMTCDSWVVAAGSSGIADIRTWLRTAPHRTGAHGSPQ